MEPNWITSLSRHVLPCSGLLLHHNHALIGFSVGLSNKVTPKTLSKMLIQKNCDAIRPLLPIPIRSRQAFCLSGFCLSPLALTIAIASLPECWCADLKIQTYTNPLIPAWSCFTPGVYATAAYAMLLSFTLITSITGYVRTHTRKERHLEGQGKFLCKKIKSLRVPYYFPVPVRVPTARKNGISARGMGMGAKKKHQRVRKRIAPAGSQSRAM